MKNLACRTAGLVSTLLVLGLGVTAQADASTLYWSNPQSLGISPAEPGATGVSCLSLSLCAVTGEYGFYDDIPYALTTTDPTAATIPWNSGKITGNGTSGVSCPSTALCLAVGNTNALITTDPTSSAPAWNGAKIENSAAGADLTAVSCPAPTLCVAVDSVGQALASAHPTAGASAWSHTKIDSLTGNTEMLDAVSCTASGMCVAVNSGGDAYVSSDPTAASPTWTQIGIDSGGTLTGVSCPSASLCAATDAEGRVLVSSTPSSAASWTRRTIDSGNKLTAVSCASDTLCVAVDNQGNALTSSAPDSAAWTSQAIDSGGQLRNVSCSSDDVCIAIDVGLVVVGTTTPPGSPTVTTASASVTNTTATLNGTVTANLDDVTDCHFDWGLTSSYGNEAPCAQSIPKGTSPVPASATITGLSPGTMYYYELTATNSYGPGYGASATFTTSGQGPSTAPVNVAATDGDGGVEVTWAPGGTGPIGSYSIREASPDGTPGSVVATVPGTSTSAMVTGLTNCDPYTFQVQASAPSGMSAWSSASSVVVPHWVPSGEPRTAVILMEGVDSTSPDQTYYAEQSNSSAYASVGSYCYGGDGEVLNRFPSSLQGLMDNFNPVFSYTTPLGPDSMTNRLATHDGTVILPWSFNGIWLQSTPQGVLVHVAASSAHQADYAPPPVDAAFLHQEIASIHQVWPDTHIVVLGHSLGGLVAEQYWEYYWRTDPGHDGVTRMIALDSPINGVQAAGLTPICEEANVCPQLGPGVYRFFADLWASMDWHDPAVSQNDTAEGSPVLFVGTQGDSAYTAADATGGPLLSQLLFSCSGLLIENCNLIAPALLSPCPSSQHAEVKVCTGVIDFVEKAVFGGGSAADGLTVASTAAPVASDVDAFAAGLLGPQRASYPEARVMNGQPWARPSAPAVAPGATLRLTGGSLGTTPGTVEVSGLGHMLAAKVLSWSTDSITARIPAGAQTGPVQVSTASGTAVPASGVAVLGAGNGVSKIAMTTKIARMAGTAARLVVRLRDGGRPAARRRVYVFDGVQLRSALSNHSGRARLTVPASVIPDLVVYTGNVWRSLSTRWLAFPVRRIKLAAKRARHAITVELTAYGRGRHRAGRVQITIAIGNVIGEASTYTLTTSRGGRAHLTVRHARPGLTITATSYAVTQVLVLRRLPRGR